MGSVWVSQCICAHYGAINMLTVEQPMCSLCGATDVLTVGQPMCLLWSSQCAYCGATNVLNVEQPMCSLWSKQCAHCGAINVHPDLYIAIQHSRNNAATKPVNIKSTRPRALHAANINQLCTFNDLMWGAVKGATVPSVMEMGQKTLTCYFQVALRLT